MTDPTFTLTAREFRDLMSPVLPMAAKDGGPMVPNAVRIETSGDFLTASATDRFVVGMCRIKPSAAPPKDLRITIPLDVIRAISSTFKPTRSVDPDLEFTVESGDRLRVRQGGGAIDFLDASIAYRLELGDYPNVSKLIIQRIESDEAVESNLAINASLLAKFTAAVRKGEPLQFKAGSNTKALLITAGDHFVGAIMPTRPVSQSVVADTRNEWAALLALPAESKKKAAR